MQNLDEKRKQSFTVLESVPVFGNSGINIEKFSPVV
jgi:hypothetical protein